MDIHAGVFGKYELQERLGRGGMAEVWKGFDPRLQRYVAIKFMQAALQSDPMFVSRFVREARAVASLRHPNIVQIYDFESPAGESEDMPAYMVMDYIEGQTLADYIRSTSGVGKFPSPTELVSLFLSISDAIDYAHQRGLQHRDIKPANILLDERHTTRNPMGEPMLTDFGIVKMLGSAAGTLTGSTVGTPLYISPEQARGKPGSAASDIYALGVILYEICTGMPPFRGDLPLVILQQHVSTKPQRPESINPDISPALSEVILRGLAKEPQDRFPDAVALTAALAAALNVPLPERQRQPISSPDIRLLPDVAGDAQETAAMKEPVAFGEGPAMLPPAMPPTFIYMPSSRASAMLTRTPETLPSESVVATPTPPAASLTPPPERERLPQTRRRRRGMWIALAAILIVVVVGSGLTALLVTHAGPASTAIVGHTYFTSSGVGDGANNMGINDTFQVHLTGVAQPQAGNSYYAWLLPDADLSEASPRALGTLAITNGVAALPAPYVDPRHNNLLSTFSRFLVTEEPTSPVPLDPSVDTKTWRYSGAIPQMPPIANCTLVTNQLSVLCHLRHLLSGDPELAQIHLPGGLNYWFLDNVEKAQNWGSEVVQSNNAVTIRHKVVDMLYLLDGTSCVGQDLLSPATSKENVPDDSTLTTLAAIPLLNCASMPDTTSYLSHIQHHLNAVVQSQGVLSDQVTLAGTISTELNTINAELVSVQQDARKLVALSDAQLVMAEETSLRNDMNALLSKVLNGDGASGAGNGEKGVASIVGQIQQLATMDITRYG